MTAFHEPIADPTSADAASMASLPPLVPAAELPPGTRRGGEEELSVGRVQADLRKPQHREITATLDYLMSTLGGTVYIEDAHGSLLFAPTRPHPDDWRDDFTPMTPPTPRQCARALESWRRAARPYAMIPGDRSFEFQRMVVPLVYCGTVFAFVHLVNSRLSATAHSENSQQLIAAIADKIFMLVFATMNEYRVRTPGTCALSSRQEVSPAHPSTTDSVAHRPPAPVGVACLVTSFALPSTEAWGGSAVIDYQSIVLRVGRVLAEAVQCICPSVTRPHPRVEESADAISLSIHLRMSPELALSAVAAAVRKALDRLDWRLTTGLGVVTGDAARGSAVESSLERASREAEAMFALEGRSEPGAHVLTRDDGAARSLMLLGDDPSAFGAYSVFITRTLENADPQLAETARTYARCDCSASATARELRLDRRTVTYRLRRISDLTGLDLPSFSAKVLIYLTFLSPA